MQHFRASRRHRDIYCTMAVSKSRISSSFCQNISFFITLGFGFCLAQVSEPFSKNENFVYANFLEKKSNFVLQRNDSLLAQLEVDSETKCQEHCTSNPLCLSINYGAADPTSNVGKILCQMFHYGRTDYQDRLVARTGFTHIRLETVCTKNPCYSGIACNPVLGNPARDHSCVCPLSDNTNVQNCDTGNVKCNALGMEALTILDSQITSSGDLSGYPKTYGRVNFGGSWIPSSLPNSWIMVDFVNSTTILAVATQGRHNAYVFITTYEVHYRLDSTHPFTAYQEDGVTKILTGNSNIADVVRHELKVPFVAKAVRFLPKTWSSGLAGWRVELYGC